MGTDLRAARVTDSHCALPRNELDRRVPRDGRDTAAHLIVACSMEPSIWVRGASCRSSDERCRRSAYHRSRVKQVGFQDPPGTMLERWPKLPCASEINRGAPAKCADGFSAPYRLGSESRSRSRTMFPSPTKHPRSSLP